MRNPPDKTVALPDGLESYYERIGALPIHWKKAVIRKEKGQYYDEKVIVNIEKDGTVNCPRENLKPTEQEQAAIRGEWPAHLEKLPKQIKAPLHARDKLVNTGDMERVFFTIWERDRFYVDDPRARRDGPSTVHSLDVVGRSRVATVRA